MERLRGSILLRLAALAMLTGLAGALTFGYLGRLHPAFDSFSHFRIHLAAAMLVVALPLLALRFRPEAVFAILFGAAAIVQTIGLPGASGVAPVRASATGEMEAVYRLLHINLRYDNPTPEAALSLIGSLRPDAVTLTEVSERWAQTLTRIEAAYPYRLICPRPAEIGGVAILSRRPFATELEPYCGDRGAFAHARLDLGGRTLDVAALHLGWPWPFEQPWQVPRVTPLLAGLGDTAIVAGDLNAVPWSRTVGRIAAAAGNARVLRGIGPTWLDRRLPAWLRPRIGLPIDNVMVKGGVLPVGLGTLDAVGSDHLPVLLEFMLLPEEKPAPVLQALWSE